MEHQGGDAVDTIPLLGAPARVVRDAARAVKRVAGLAIQAVTAGTLTQLLGLPGLVVTEYALEKQGEGDVLHVFCQHEHEVAVCSRCGVLSVVEHESEERCVRHLDIWGKRTFVHFSARRFECTHCRKPFTEGRPAGCPPRRTRSGSRAGRPAGPERIHAHRPRRSSG